MPDMTRPSPWFLLTWAWTMIGLIGAGRGLGYAWIGTAVICTTLCSGIGCILEAVRKP